MSQSILKDVLPNAVANSDITRFTSVLKPVYDLNLPDKKERRDIQRLRDNLAKTVIEIDSPILSNVLYYDLCERQSKSIALELIKNEEIGVDYHGALFLRLVENYNESISLINAELQKKFDAVKASELLSGAKDILFVQRFNSFWRYDRWDIGNEPIEMKKSPERMFVAMMNQDLSFGQFWDNTVSLKNEMVQEAFQLAIDDLQDGALNKDGFLEKSIGIGADTSVEDRERYALRLIDLVSGNVDDYSGASFSYDGSKISRIREMAEKSLSDPIARMKEFIAKENPAPRSIRELLEELEKDNIGPKGRGPKLT